MESCLTIVSSTSKFICRKLSKMAISKEGRFMESREIKLDFKGDFGQVRIPKDMLSFLGIKMDTKLKCVVDDDKIILILKKRRFKESPLGHYMKEILAGSRVTVEDARKALSSLKEPLSKEIFREREERI